MNDSKRTILIHSQIIDGTGRDPIEDGYVEYDNGRIVGVGRASEMPMPHASSAEVLDGSELVVLPGLIDAHAHLVYDRYRSLEEMSGTSIEASTLAAVRNAGTVLAAGYTTVRDVGCVGNIAVHVRDAIAAGRLRGPRVVASARVINTSRGPFFAAEACSCSGFAVVADGPDGISGAVREQLAGGVDFVKLFASGLEASDRVSSTVTAMEEAELSAAVKTAHAGGVKVAVHCQTATSVKSALRAGADTIEHGNRLDEEGLELFASSNTYLVPTLSTLYSVVELGEELGLRQDYRDEMDGNAQSWRESLKAAHSAGVPVAAGGDVGNRYFHGQNAKELEHLTTEIMDPMGAIVAGTATASRAIGVADRVGTIEVGKLADLLVVSGDPLSNIKVLQDMNAIRAVVQGGDVVSGTLRPTTT